MAVAEKVQYMSREELTAVVLQVKEREEGASLLLWEGVSRFIFQQARRRVMATVNPLPLEDVGQVGFIAMMEAVDSFDTEQEAYSFFSTLAYRLQSNFAKEAGTRTSKRDGLLFAVSGDAPLTASSEEENFTMFSTLADEEGERPFLDLEYADLLQYSRRLILEALGTLPEREGEVIRLWDLDGWTRHGIADLLDISPQYVSQLRRNGFDRLASGEYQRALCEALRALGEYGDIASATHGGLGNFARTGFSSVEASVLMGE